MGDNDLDTSVLTKEIIGTTPSWIIQWGITLIFLIFIGIGLALALIKYPISRQLDALITYESQPLPLTAPENSRLIAVYVRDTASITKYQPVMTLENEMGYQYMLKAPVTGRLYLANRWRPNAFVYTGRVLGFIVPETDERILRLKMTAADVTHLKNGQKVVVDVDRPIRIRRSIPAYIDFIGPAFGNQSYYSVNIKFRSTERAWLYSMPLFRTIDTLHCNVRITIDTTTCLNYFLLKAKN